MNLQNELIFMVGLITGLAFLALHRWREIRYRYKCREKNCAFKIAANQKPFVDKMKRDHQESHRRIEASSHYDWH